jgi:hypothetical protein
MSEAKPNLFRRADPASPVRCALSEKDWRYKRVNCTRPLVLRGRERCWAAAAKLPSASNPLESNMVRAVALSESGENSRRASSTVIHPICPCDSWRKEAERACSLDAFNLISSSASREGRLKRDLSHSHQFPIISSVNSESGPDTAKERRREYHGPPHTRAPLGGGGPIFTCRTAPGPFGVRGWSREDHALRPSETPFAIRRGPRWRGKKRRHRGTTVDRPNHVMVRLLAALEEY